jgi:chromosome segregation ATPase
MFSQLTSLASKFSLDNLQNPQGDSAPPLSVEDARSAQPDPADDFSARRAAPSAPHHDNSDELVAAVQQIQDLEASIQKLRRDLKSSSKIVDDKLSQISDLEEELNVQRAVNKEITGKYQSLLSSSATSKATICSLQEEVSTLRSQLTAEQSVTAELRIKLAASAAISVDSSSGAGVSDDSTPKKTPKKVVKKKKTVVDSENVAAVASPTTDAHSSLAVNTDEDKSSRLAAELETALARIAVLEKSLAESVAQNEFGADGASLRIRELADHVAQSELQVQNAVAQAASSQREAEARIVQADEKLSRLQQQLAEKESSHREEIARLGQDRREAEEALLLKLNESSRIISEKEERITEVTTKFTTLTDKAKDYVKKYSEAKSTIANLEESKAALSEELGRTYQQLVSTLPFHFFPFRYYNEITDCLVQESRESELLALKLKFDAQDAMTSSQRSAAHDLGDKLAETQRELQRTKAALQDSRNTIEVMARDAAEAEQAVKEANDRAGAVQAQLAQQKQEREKELVDALAAKVGGLRCTVLVRMR